jgi:hypothetical protein
VTEIPLKARINGARAWKPKADRTTDEMITGTVVAIVARTSDYGTYPVVVLDTGQEALSAFHAFHQVAIDQLKEVKPARGESLTIVAHPKVDSKKRKQADGSATQYTPYTIFNPDAPDAEPAEYDWDAADAAEPGY